MLRLLEERRSLFFQIEREDMPDDSLLHTGFPPNESSWFAVFALSEKPMVFSANLQ